MEELDESDLLARITAAAQTRYPGAEVTGLRRLEGGVSSLTFASALAVEEEDDLPIVIKVAPPGLAPVRNRDVLRQARVQGSLDGLEGFPVPVVVLKPGGDPPAFAMALHPGDAYEPRLDVSDDPPSAEDAAERMRVAARALAQFHSADPMKLGLGQEPVIGPAEELGRWAQLFDTVDEDLSQGHEELRRRLAERIPAAARPTLQHGDYRLANMLFEGTELQAVIDWELWSVGDPRFDLCWLLMHTDPPHTFHAHRPPADIRAGSQVPSAAELLEEFLRASTSEGVTELPPLVTGDLEWFLGVCIYKTASTIAAIAKRERRSADPKEHVLYAADHLDEILQAGHHTLDRQIG